MPETEVLERPADEETEAVSQDADGRIWLEQVPKGAIAELVGQPERYELVHLSGDTFVTAKPDHGMHLPHVFVGDDGHGQSRFLHSGRATPRAIAP